VIHLKRILVPTDFSESAHHALRYAVSLAQEFHSEIGLLHVVEDVAVGYASDLFPVPMAEVFHEISAFAKKELAELAAEVRSHGVEVREHVVQGKPSAEVVRIAREDAVDMIIMGTHGRGVPSPHLPVARTRDEERLTESHARRLGHRPAESSS
jgi:universal stress protein A